MNVFVFAIGIDGIEMFYDVTEEIDAFETISEEKMMARLKGEDFKMPSSSLPAIMMRCRFTPHRNLIPYAIRTEISKEDMEEAIETNEDGIIELIEQKGVKLPF